jgi:uncharacterized coiled-coil DUF342 family protein
MDIDKIKKQLDAQTADEQSKLGELKFRVQEYHNRIQEYQAEIKHCEAKVAELNPYLDSVSITPDEAVEIQQDIDDLGRKAVTLQRLIDTLTSKIPELESDITETERAIVAGFRVILNERKAGVEHDMAEKIREAREFRDGFTSMIKQLATDYNLSQYRHTICGKIATI